MKIAKNTSLLELARNFVAENIKPDFHDKRLAAIEALKFDVVLKRKNPYLFRAKAVASAPDLVRGLLEAHLSSQEETIFGAFLESLACFVCGHIFGGIKPATHGVDLDFTRGGQRFLVSVKSGPNWGNSSQIKKMLDDFSRARKIIGPKQQIVMVNGCCYGKDSKPHKPAGNYVKLCGQDFWFLVSGEPDMYREIVEPLGQHAQARNDEFAEAYGRALTRFTKEFTSKFCASDGSIDWVAIIDLNSRSEQLWSA